MSKNPFDGADSSIDISEHGDRIEVYLGEHGHVCIRQTNKLNVDAYPIVVVDPRNVDSLIAVIRLAADHALVKNPDGPKS